MFAANGKAGITVRQALCHQTGLQTLRTPVFDIDRAADWGYIIGLIEQQAPLWEPGSKASR